jgi:hypothetical protein
MQKPATLTPPRHRTADSEGEGETSGAREIVIPHDGSAPPVSGVRNVLLQASLAELKANGYYERYTSLIAPDVLEALLSSLAPGWIPLTVALAHYEACDKLALSAGEFVAMGKRVGDRVQDTFLVSLGKKGKDANFDLWAAVGPLHRMWPRLFKGGSVQTVKLGPKEMLLEEWGFRLNVYEYYRQGHLAALRSTYGALGTRITQVKVVSYDVAHDEMIVSIRWQ